MADDEEVYADGFIKVPKRRLWQIADIFSRQDEIQAATLKVLGKINEKLAAEAPPPAYPPAPSPAPPELTPVTDRLDIILNRIKGIPIDVVDRYAGAAITWQTLVSWNVGVLWKKKYGTLREISMTTNNFPNTRFRLRLELGEPLEEKITLFDELEIQNVLTRPYPWNRLPYGTWIYLDVRSIGPAIVANGAITGVEWSS